MLRSRRCPTSTTSGTFMAADNEPTLPFGAFGTACHHPARSRVSLAVVMLASPMYPAPLPRVAAARPCEMPCTRFSNRSGCAACSRNELASSGVTSHQRYAAPGGGWGSVKLDGARAANEWTTGSGRTVSATSGTVSAATAAAAASAAAAAAASAVAAASTAPAASSVDCRATLSLLVEDFRLSLDATEEAGERVASGDFGSLALGGVGVESASFERGVGVVATSDHRGCFVLASQPSGFSQADSPVIVL
mmetsp:Transcript_59/g.121  ORF Transcript_59/g.121 Transcript_59/m.121 type:complete len:250 (-) Transcript_59:1091-1840(-)